jgi:Tfp pilus assembly ATPase PilU
MRLLLLKRVTWYLQRCMQTMPTKHIDRIVHFFEADRHNQLHMDLSLNLKAMVAQQLDSDARWSFTSCSN